MKIREAVPDDISGIANVHVDTWRTTYVGIVPDEVLSGLSYDRYKRGWRKSLEESDSEQYTYVADNDKSGVIGFVAAGSPRDEIEDYDGEIYAIYVLKQHQGKGIGRQLMSEAAQRLKAEGLSSVMLWVLADNPTRRFYEALGGKLVAEKEIDIGGKSLPEVGYGWQSLDALIAHNDPRN